MVYLGAALGGGQGHVLEQAIFPLVEKEPNTEIDKPLPDHPFEPGRFEQGRNQQQWQEKPELSQQWRYGSSDIHVI